MSESIWENLVYVVNDRIDITPQYTQFDELMRLSGRHGLFNVDSSVIEQQVREIIDTAVYIPLVESTEDLI